MTQHYFGHRIQQLRKSKGWSQADLAKRLGKKASSISSYETDAKAIPVDTLILLAELWDVTIDELIYGENVVNFGDRATPARTFSHAFTAEQPHCHGGQPQG